MPAPPGRLTVGREHQSSFAICRVLFPLQKYARGLASCSSSAIISPFTIVWVGGSTVGAGQIALYRGVDQATQLSNPISVWNYLPVLLFLNGPFP